MVLLCKACGGRGAGPGRVGAAHGGPGPYTLAPSLRPSGLWGREKRCHQVHLQVCLEGRDYGHLNPAPSVSVGAKAQWTGL